MYVLYYPGVIAVATSIETCIYYLIHKYCMKNICICRIDVHSICGIHLKCWDSLRGNVGESEREVTSAFVSAFHLVLVVGRECYY